MNNTDIGNKILGTKPEKQNNLSETIAHTLATLRLSPTDSAILNFLDRMTRAEIITMLDWDTVNE